MDVATVGRNRLHCGDTSWRWQLPTAIIGAEAVDLGVCLIEKIGIGDSHRKAAMEDEELAFMQDRVMPRISQ